VINKALDLPYEEVAETYSTSPELFHELGIPAGATGRLVPAKPEEKRPARDRDGGRPGRDGQRRSRDDDRRGGSDGRPRRERRTRSGPGSGPGDDRAATSRGRQGDGSGRPARTERSAPPGPTEGADSAEHSERGADVRSADGRPQRTRRRTRRRHGAGQGSGQPAAPRAATGSVQDGPPSSG
jgi:hypothetical protein